MGAARVMEEFGASMKHATRGVGRTISESCRTQSSGASSSSHSETRMATCSASSAQRHNHSYRAQTVSRRGPTNSCDGHLVLGEDGLCSPLLGLLLEVRLVRAILPCLVGQETHSAPALLPFLRGQWYADCVVAVCSCFRDGLQRWRPPTQIR